MICRKGKEEKKSINLLLFLPLTISMTCESGQSWKYGNIILVYNSN